jgi:hypothetical protein
MGETACAKRDNAEVLGEKGFVRRLRCAGSPMVHPKYSPGVNRGSGGSTSGVDLVSSS